MCQPYIESATAVSVYKIQPDIHTDLIYADRVK